MAYLKTVVAWLASDRRVASDDRESETETPPLEPCRRCRIAYRLVGIEGTDKPHHDLYTFECPSCRHIEVMLVRMQ